MLWSIGKVQTHQFQPARQLLKACLLFCLVYGALAASSALAWSPPPPEPSPEPIIPQADPKPGKPNLLLSVRDALNLSWSATSDAEYYIVYANSSNAWQEVARTNNSGFTFQLDYQNRDWDLTTLALRILACKSKPDWLWWAFWDTADRCSDYSDVVYTKDHIPSLTFTAPVADERIWPTGYTIQWTATSPNYFGAEISLYFDTDSAGHDGTLIVGGLIQGANTSYLWDTSELPEGDYYIYAKIDDGVVPPVYAYANGRTVLSMIKLNDTGITWGGNYSSGNNSTCTGETITQQDCSHGRDARAAAGTLTKVGGGAAGFDFTKLDINGNALSASATNHHCVRDNHTGLIWEVKTDDGGIHDKDNTYRWGGKTALVNQQARDNGWGSFYNDWDTLVDGSNNESLCGFSDWRIPTLMELDSIVDAGRINPSIDSNYFPNTRSSRYWSSSPDAGDRGNAWIVYFRNGYDDYVSRGSGDAVRLVRGGQ